MLRGRAIAIAASILLGGCSPVTVLNGLAQGGFSVTKDVAYAPGPRGMLDVYAPRNAAGAPVVVFFYGGSWQEGDKGMYRFVGAALAQHGIVAIIPDYRVYPAAKFPGFLQDCAAAVRWSRDHAADYGGDPQHLFLMGHSAGAYNAAMLALDPEWLGAEGMSPRDISGLIGLAGPYDFLPLTDPVLKTIFGNPDELARTQPINFVTPGAPPAFLAAGDKDTTVYPRNSVHLAERLQAAGDEVTLKIYPGLDHVKLAGALSPLLAPFLAPVLGDCLAFIRTHSQQKYRSAA
jgi:acetyl esterase/lipase